VDKCAAADIFVDTTHPEQRAGWLLSDASNNALQRPIR